MTTSTIAQREQLVEVVMRLRALGFDLAASQVRVGKDRKVTLSEPLLNALISKATPPRERVRITPW